MRAVRLTALTVCLFAAATLTAQEHHPTPIPNAAFDRLKTLVGDWKGVYKGAEGTMEGKAQFKVVSGGSAIVLSMDEGEAGEMITVFHPDGQTAMMATHYCSAQNQPRLRLAKMTSPNQLVFEFVDGVNIDPKQHSMKKLVITIVDADHHTAEWTSEADGKPWAGKFEYTRVKS
jgi:hypothetical protein